MALRFQEFDEADRELKKQSRRAEGTVVIFLFVMAALLGTTSWIRGESMAAWERTIAILVGLPFFWFVYTTLARFYTEFAIRAKEIEGKVSAIENTVDALKSTQSDILLKLTAIEDKLEAQRSDGEEFKWTPKSPSHLPIDIATEDDISRAISKALNETQANSFADMGLVIKSARAHLKGKLFEESELQSLVRRVDLLQKQPNTSNKEAGN